MSSRVMLSREILSGTYWFLMNRLILATVRLWPLDGVNPEMSKLGKGKEANRPWFKIRIHGACGAKRSVQRPRGAPYRIVY